MHCKRGPVLRHSNWKRRNEEKQKKIYKATSTIFISSMCVCGVLCTRAVRMKTFICCFSLFSRSALENRCFPLQCARVTDSCRPITVATGYHIATKHKHSIEPHDKTECGSAEKERNEKKILRCGGFRGNSLTNLNILSMFAQRPRNDMHCSEEILIAIEFALLVVVAAILLCAECFAFFFLLNG